MISTAAIPLSLVLDRWDRWAQRADRTEDGWESDFPEWRQLMSAAEHAMIDFSGSPEDLALIARAFAIAEETEHLHDFAAGNVSRLAKLLAELAHSMDWRVRWQAFSAAAAAGRSSVPLLLRGLCDEDAYCRRRALLALLTVDPSLKADARAVLAGDRDATIQRILQD